jgi:hypothetical protein
MTPEEFVNQTLGKVIWTEPYYGAQCVGAFKAFCEKVGIGAYPTPNGYADGYWYGREDHAKDFDFITNNYRNGDWVIWAQGSEGHEDSHIAMYYNGEQFSQNQGGHDEMTLQACDTWGNALGALRWKGWEDEKSMEFTRVDRAVYRLHNPNNTAERVWTASAEEAEMLIDAGWEYEGIAWYSADAPTGGN